MRSCALFTHSCLDRHMQTLAAGQSIAIALRRTACQSCHAAIRYSNGGDGRDCEYGGGDGYGHFNDSENMVKVKHVCCSMTGTNECF